MRDEGRRKSRRVVISRDVVRELDMWPGVGVKPDGVVDLGELGEPRVRYGHLKNYSLLIHDLSAGGVRLTVRSSMFNERDLASMKGEKLLMRLTLADPDQPDKDASVLLLCEVLHEIRSGHRVESGMRFLSWADMAAGNGTFALARTPSRGAPPLAAWCERFQVQDSPQDDPDPSQSR